MMKRIFTSLVFLLGLSHFGKPATSSSCPESLDQQLTVFDTGTWGNDQWQSFTSGMTGKLTKIELFKNACENYSFTLSIYDGTGTTGTLLFSDIYAFNTCSQWISMSIPYASAPSVFTGSTYTFRLEVISSDLGSPLMFVAQSGNPYASGQYYSSAYGPTTGWDLDFKTYVSLLNPPSINVSGKTNATCFGYSDGTISTTTAGGTSPYNYSWSPGGQTTANITNASAGLHTVTVTDAVGCTSTDTATINEPPPVPANAGPDYVICSGSSATITASGGVTYSWSPSWSLSSPGSATTVATPTTTTNYNVTVTDAAGCFASDIMTIIVNALPSVTLNAFSDVCVNAFPFSLTGGSPAGGTYSGPGVFSGTFDPASAGTGVHTITYTYTDASGCSNSASQTINVNPLPAVSFSSIPSTCTNNSPFALSGGTPPGGTYSGPGVVSGVFDPGFTGAGSFNLQYTVTDGNGCSNTATQVIEVFTPPSVTFASLADQCEDMSAFTLTGGSPAGGNYSGTGVISNNFDPSSTGPGSFTIDYIYMDASGCSDTAFQTQIVNPLPSVIITSNPAVCDGTSVVTLSASPVGGSFSGTGVTGNLFDPSVAGPGTFTLSYTFSDGNGCINSDSYLQEVYALPTVILSPLTPLCIDALPYTYTEGSPAGGSYSGTGVSSGVFDPAIAGSGSHSITYFYTDVNGCSNSDFQDQVVNDLPVVVQSTLPDVCVDASTFTLTGGSPAGGNYSGPGVSGNFFDASVAGTGSHPITYTVTDGNGCTNSDSEVQTVNSLPVVTFSALSDVCISQPAFTLNGGSPYGGTYSGTGVTGLNFDPSIAGSGTHTLTYTYTDNNSCSSAANSAQTVHSLPVVTLNTFSDVCINAPAFALSGGSPTGGVYSGNGVSNGNFDPSAAGAGTHSISYSVTDANGCTNTASRNITVNPLPTVTLSGFSSVCENEPVFTLTGGNPTGGNFSGPGVNSNSFDAAIAGSGIHNIVYSYTDVNGCSNTASGTLEVFTLPSVSITSNSAVCENASSFPLNGVPVGGTFSGTGVISSNFDPAVSGPGSYTVTYTYVDVNGCSNSDSYVQYVNAKPSVTLSPLSDVCANTPPITLTGGSPSGGIFSGTGISSNMFDPSVSGTGSHQVIYSYTDVNGCTNSDTTNQVVNGIPTVTFSSLSPVCINAATFALSAGSPSGGTYSGPGITSNIFDPSAAGAGSHSIIYIYTDVNGCSDSSAQIQIVNNLPVINFVALSPVCADESAFALNSASPSGGTYTGTGVSNGFFDPSVSGTGTFPVTYAYTDINGCSNSSSQNQVVNTLPAVTLATFSDVCINSSPFTLSGGTPSGGIYSGNGITSMNIFNPSVAGVGSTSVVYTYTDANGCTDFSIGSINVNSLPVVNAGTDLQICGNSFAGLSASGAVNYSWSPVTGLSDPSIANPFASPSVTTTYTVTGTNSSGCSATDQLTVAVDNGSGIFVSEDQQMCSGSSLILSAGGGDLYFWSGQSIDDSLSSGPIVRPDSTTTYYVDITTSSGCIFTDSVLVTVIFGGDCEVETFNSFSPDGDGVNDSWRIANIESFPENKVTIINRWGNILVEFSNYNNNDVVWDGSVEGDLLPTGTYFYIIQTFDPDKSFSGWIFLTR